MARAAKSDAVECPRCGYDVSGVMSLWKTECPLRGKCSECGYAFQWRHLLGPNLGVPKWFFETAHRRKIRAAISTSARTLAPWHFWSAVQMRTPSRPWRLMMLSVATLVGVYLAGVVGVGLPTTMEIFRFSGGYQGWFGDWTEYYLSPSLMWIAGVDPSSPLRDSSLAPALGSIASRLALLSAILIPAGFLLVPATRRAAKVRMRHVIRAGAFGWVGVCVLLAMWWVAMTAVDIAADNGFVDPTVSDGIIAASAFVWTVYVLLFWLCVCRQYLCIKQPFSTALLLCTMGTLLSVVGLGIVLSLLHAPAL